MEMSEINVGLAPQRAAQGRETQAGWSAEALDILRKARTEDGLSGGEIVRRLASEIGLITTRSAVIAKINRCGWQKGGGNAPLAIAQAAANGRKSRSVSAGPAREKRATQEPFKVMTEAEFAEALHEPVEAVAGKVGAMGENWGDVFPALPEAKGIETLRFSTCRWPVGAASGRGQPFCGATTAGIKPYCPGHCAIAYRPVDKRRNPGAPREGVVARSAEDETPRDLTEVLA